MANLEDLFPLVHKDYLDLTPKLPEQPRFELRKIKYSGVIKWIKVYTNQNQVQYADFIQAVKVNCNIDDANDITIKDDDGALIEAELFECFPNNIVFHVFRRCEDTCSDRADTVSLSNVSSLTDITNDSDASNCSKRRKFSDLNIEEGILSSPGGIDITEEYKSSQTLSANTRRKLVNVIVNLMVQKFGYHPSSEQKIAYAKAIVDLFP